MLSQVANWNGTDSCGKTLTTKVGLEEHIRTAHQGLPPSRKPQRPTKHGVPDGPARKHQVSVFTRLTGIGYEEKSGRQVPCLVVGCSHRFLREYDLEIHLQSRHGLADLGVREMPTEREGLYSRHTLQGSPTFATKEDIDAEWALDMQSDDADVVDHEETLGAWKGPDLWPGRKSYHERADGGEWLRDELEMRCLIDGDLILERHETVDGQEVDVVDPALQ